jgi:isoamylase
MQLRLAMALTRFEWRGSMTELAIEQSHTNGFAAPTEKGEVQEGNPVSWRAHQREDGVNFALFSRHTSRVRIELYQNADDSTATRIIELDPVRHRTGDVWHVWVRSIPAGQLYGYRIEGPYQPEQGHRFNPHKLLLDPIARAIAGVNGAQFVENTIVSRRASEVSRQ